MLQIDRPQLKQMNYEIFVIILTLLSWINTILFFVFVDGDGRKIVLWVQLVLSLFFFLDFLYRLKKAEDRNAYFKKVGWLDLIGSLPFLQWFRAYRVFRTSQYIRHARGRLDPPRSREWEARGGPSAGRRSERWSSCLVRP